MTFFVGLLAYVRIRPALESRAVAERKKLSQSGVNPNALKGWEFLKKDQNLTDSSGLSVGTRKRMRELYSLHLRGSLAAFTNISLDLQGDDHDKLVVACDSLKPQGAKLREAIQEVDADFWNRTRLFDFAEILFKWADHSESVPRSRIKEWSHDFENFVSNTHALYQNGVFDSQGSDFNPATQRTLRQNLASTLSGGLNSIHKSLIAKLDDETEDKLVIHMSQMTAQVADELLEAFRKDKAGNFWNGLRALGFRELILRGDNYHRSIPRSEFIQWCHDYESYLSEFRKVAGQLSGGFSREATNVTR